MKTVKSSLLMPLPNLNDNNLNPTETARLRLHYQKELKFFYFVLRANQSVKDDK